MHIVVIFMNIGDYHAARLKAANVACRKKGWRLTAVQVTSETFEHDWGDIASDLGIPVRSLLEPGSIESSDSKAPFTRRTAKLLERSLNELQPNAVLVPGWSLPIAVSALKWCKRNGRIAILASESNEFDAPRKWWREYIKGRRVRQFSTALVGGPSHARYLVKLGFESSKIFYGYDVVDNEAFNPQRIRSLNNPHPRPFFLAVNRFVPKKNLVLLLRSYREYRRQTKGSPWDLVLCGDGPLRSELEQFIDREQLSDFVRLPGFLRQRELLPYFAHAKCFVHVSTEEQWGLVINEAAASGLPLIVSNRCGCFESLVSEGVNGFGIEPTDGGRLTELMLKVSSKSVDLSSMGQASLELSKKLPAALFGEGLVHAADPL